LGIRFFRFLSALGLFFGSPVLSVSLAIILAAFWNWKLPFQRHVATFLEFEPLIFHGICNILVFELFMSHGILHLGFIEGWFRVDIFKGWFSG
jgi:hypothetical protein